MRQDFCTVEGRPRQIGVDIRTEQGREDHLQKGQQPTHRIRGRARRAVVEDAAWASASLEVLVGGARSFPRYIGVVAARGRVAYRQFFCGMASPRCAYTFCIRVDPLPPGGSEVRCAEPACQFPIALGILCGVS